MLFFIFISQTIDSKGPNINKAITQKLYFSTEFNRTGIIFNLSIFSQFIFLNIFGRNQNRLTMTAISNVGGKIKQVRELKKISIEELAQRCNLDIEQLKLIENNELIPAISPLVKISRALSVRLGTFLDDTEHLGPVVCKCDEKEKSESLSNANTKARVNLNFFSMAKGKSCRHMEPFMVDIEPDSVASTTSTHEGEEFLFVLDGQVKVTYGTDTYILDKGDSIYYDSIINHKVNSATDQVAKILAVVYTPL